jgi:outer membrane biosynthesis protein TonB
MPDPEPKESLKAGIEGDVELRALVGNNGKTLDLTGLEGEPVFATPALEAIRTWQFHPVFIGATPRDGFENPSQIRSDSAAGGYRLGDRVASRNCRGR